MKPASQVHLDLLTWKPLRALVLSPAFPVALQVTMLGIVIALAVVGYGIGLDMSGDELRTLRKTNLATLVVWGLWWPGMIAVALAMGRAWCTVCPMELVNRVGDAAARKIGWPRATLGRFLRAGWLVLAAYLTLQILVAGLSVHRVPHSTAVLLLVLMGGALATGLVFREPRAFCRAFCPASALLSVYGRQTPFQLEMRDPSVCERCSTQDCVRAENRFRFDGRSCPSLLRPFKRQPSDGCILCLQCAKVCPHDNVGVGLVSSAAPIRQKYLLRPYEAAFVMVALGFVTHELAGEVAWLDAVFHRVPAALNGMIPVVSFGWLEALWFLVLFPALVWTSIAAGAYLLGHRAGIASLLLAAATGAAPVVAVAHLAKAVAKVASWGAFLPLALDDPRGIETLRELSNHSIQQPASLLGLSVIGWVILVLTAVVAWKGYRWIRQLPSDAVPAATMGMTVAAALFASVLTVWSWPGS